MEWYYMQGDQRVGPIPDRELDERIQNGLIPPQTLVWRQGMTTWRPLADARADSVPPPLVPGAGESAGNPCAECGRLFPPSEMIRYGNTYICAGCKPVFLQKLKEGIQPAGELRYAGFGIRLGAKVIDGILLWVVNTAIQLAVFGSITMSGLDPQKPTFWAMYFLVVFLSFGTQAAYSIFLHGKYGATLGKRACKIRVVNANGTPITYGRATGRYFAELLSSLTLLVGYLIAAFDVEKRTLHDRICNTRVVYR